MPDPARGEVRAEKTGHKDAGVAFEILAKELRPTGGGMFCGVHRGRLLKPILRESEAARVLVFSCRLRIAEDTFDFELFGGVEPCLNALKSLISTMAEGEAVSARIDIPDHDGDFAMRRLKDDEFLLEIAHGGRVLSAVPASAKDLRDSLDGIRDIAGI